MDVAGGGTSAFALDIDSRRSIRPIAGHEARSSMASLVALEASRVQGLGVSGLESPESGVPDLCTGRQGQAERDSATWCPVWRADDLLLVYEED